MASSVILSHAHGENNHAGNVRPCFALTLNRPRLDRGVQHGYYDLRCSRQGKRDRASRVVPRAGWRGPTIGSILIAYAGLPHPCAETKPFLVAHARDGAACCGLVLGGSPKRQA